VLTGQGKVGIHPVSRGEDKALACNEPRGNSREENRKAADEVHIPGSVMQVFGFHRRIRCDR
jgi:hypothetical protein